MTDSATPFRPEDFMWVAAVLGSLPPGAPQLINPRMRVTYRPDSAHGRFLVASSGPWLVWCPRCIRKGPAGPFHGYETAADAGDAARQHARQEHSRPRPVIGRGPGFGGVLGTALGHYAPPPRGPAFRFADGIVRATEGGW